MDTTTPKEISNRIIKLCRKLVLNGIPTYVDVTPEQYSIPNECYSNVAEKVKRDAGQIQYGWQIWEMDSVFIEAEFHSVWVSPTGNYIDVTPKDNGEERILFLADPQRVYANKTIDNVRMALTDDKLVKDFITLSIQIARHKIDNEGENDPTIAHLDPNVFFPLIKKHTDVLQFIKEGKTENDLCYCKSGRKYKNCCKL